MTFAKIKWMYRTRLHKYIYIKNNNMFFSLFNNNKKKLCHIYTSFYVLFQHEYFCPQVGFHLVCVRWSKFPHIMFFLHHKNIIFSRAIPTFTLLWKYLRFFQKKTDICIVIKRNMYVDGGMTLWIWAWACVIYIDT